MRRDPVILMAAAALMLQACAATGTPTPALQAARRAVRVAEADPLVSLYALEDLETAERQLEVAETARSPARRRQAAYLATQHADLARVLAVIGTDHAGLLAAQRPLRFSTDGPTAAK